MADETRSAGWYPDPDGAAGERWWNGAGWSDARRGGAAAAASSPYGPAGAAPAPAMAVPPVPVAPTTVPPIPVPPVPVAPVPVFPTAATPAPVIYSAENPPPQRPDPYAGAYVAPPSAGRSSVNVNVNRNAMVGFVTGLVSLFANLFYVLGPLSIVFSALGLVKARQLRAQGVTGTLMVFAIVGLVAGIIATVIGFVTIAAFFVGLFSGS